MFDSLVRLLDLFDGPDLETTQVIRWSSPIPAFGDPSTSVVATLGINPSNLEFMDDNGDELAGQDRRFHTLGSLGLDSWAAADYRHMRLIINSCKNYFSGNPYDRWFKKLDRVVSGTGASYYDLFSSACHLDLIPYATEHKWTDLDGAERKTLLNAAQDELLHILKNSRIKILILNGKSVVNRFQDFADLDLLVEENSSWALPRRSGEHVMGFAYKGYLRHLRGYDLGREILILGFNHNLQSSFGVTNHVIKRIRDWISTSTKAML